MAEINSIQMSNVRRGTKGVETGGGGGGGQGGELAQYFDWNYEFYGLAGFSFIVSSPCLLKYQHKFYTQPFLFTPYPPNNFYLPASLMVSNNSKICLDYCSYIAISM